jgi:chromosomal replication initiation ATPase DnaA
MLQQILPFYEEMMPELVVGNANMLAYRYLFEERTWQHPLCWLQGEEGSGKTLLAHYWQRTRHGNMLRLTQDAALSLMPEGEYVLDPVPEAEELQEPLFHLLTQAHAVQAKLVICSRHFPAHHPTILKDVSSRLKAAHVVSLGMPEDDMVKAVLMAHAAMRQLRIEAGVIDYIIPRMQRSCGAAALLMKALDVHNLHHKRPITLPVVREVMGNTILL